MWQLIGNPRPSSGLCKLFYVCGTDEPAKAHIHSQENLILISKKTSNKKGTTSLYSFSKGMLRLLFSMSLSVALKKQNEILKIA